MTPTALQILLVEDDDKIRDTFTQFLNQSRRCAR